MILESPFVKIVAFPLSENFNVVTNTLIWNAVVANKARCCDLSTILTSESIPDCEKSYP